jgi:large subunit ribosomal protein L22
MTVAFQATHRYARITSRKVRYVVDMIRGRSVSDALDILRNDKHRASRLVEKLLASAVANALQNPTVKANRLLVQGAAADCGPLLFGRYRFRPGPMGRAMPIRKRTCHIRIQLADPGASPARTEPAPGKEE